MFTNYIPKKVIRKLHSSSESKPTKLLAFIDAINISYKSGHFFMVVILVRAILDYVPPIFGFDKATTLVSQISNKRTFKKAIKLLNDSSRQVADDLLHNAAHKPEILKVDKISCDNIRDNLLIVLDEVSKQLADNDLRKKPTGRKKSTSNKSKTQLEKFEDHIADRKNWYEQELDDKKIWIYEKDNLYQIHKLHDYEDFSEPWTQVYPDSGGSASFNVNLVYNNNHIKQFQFVYCDGGRINVVMPKVELDAAKNYWENKDLYGGSYKNVHYFWEKKSLDFKLMQLIGKFYIYKTPEEIGRISKIEIR